MMAPCKVWCCGPEFYCSLIIEVVTVPLARSLVCCITLASDLAVWYQAGPAVFVFASAA